MTFDAKEVVQFLGLLSAVLGSSWAVVQKFSAGIAALSERISVLGAKIEAESKRNDERLRQLELTCTALDNRLRELERSP